MPALFQNAVNLFGVEIIPHFVNSIAKLPSANNPRINKRANIADNLRDLLDSNRILNRKAASVNIEAGVVTHFIARKGGFFCR
jgi:hypothetical protein